MTTGMPNRDLVAAGQALQPDPWDVAHELWYWKSSGDPIDPPLPKDAIRYRKYVRLNFPLDYPRFSDVDE